MPEDSARFLKALVQKLEAAARDSVARITGVWPADTIVPPYLGSLESAALRCDWAALQNELDNHVWQGGRGDPDWRIGLALAKIAETCGERGLDEYAAYLNGEAATVLEIYSPRELTPELTEFAKRLRSKATRSDATDPTPDEAESQDGVSAEGQEESGDDGPEPAAWVFSDLDAPVPASTEPDWEEQLAADPEQFALRLLDENGPLSLASLPSWEWETRLQATLFALKEAGALPESIFHRGLEWLVTGANTTASSLLTDCVLHACEQDTRLQDTLRSRFTQTEYARFTGFRELPKPCSSWEDWEYQGWAVYEDDWPLAAAAWRYLPESRMLSILAEPLPEQTPAHRTLHYLVVRKLWRDNAVSLPRLDALATLVSRLDGQAEMRALHGRALLVLADQWKRFNWERSQQQAAQVAAVLAEIAAAKGFEDAPRLNGTGDVEAPPRPMDPDANLPPAQRQRARRIRSLMQQLSAHPGDCGSWHDLAALYVEQGDLPRAIEAETSAIGANPLYAAAYYGRARIHMRQKYYPQARSDFSSVILLVEENGGMNRYLTTEAPPPIYVDSYRTRGVAWCHEGDYEHGLGDIDNAVRLAPYDAVLRWEQGYLLGKAGRRSASIEAYVCAGRLALDAQNMALITKITSALRGLGAVEQARELESGCEQNEESDLP